MSRSSALLAVGAVLTALVVSPVASADAAPAQPRAADSATASGRHFYTFSEADVVTGSPGNYLVIAYIAGRALTDGTIRIALPRGPWRTPLHAVDGLLGEGPVYDGGVAVRPLSDFTPVLPEPGVDPDASCSPLPASPLPWTVQTLLGSQVIVVRHVDCAAGQKLYVHIKGLTAPSRVGRYFLPVVASDRSGLPRLTAASVDVVPTPRVALRVTMPDTVLTGSPGAVAEVDAVRPDGRPTTDYTGAVAVVSEDCTMTPRGQRVAYQFTRADAGTALIHVTFAQPDVAHHLRVYDIANKAVAGVSGRFDVVGPPDLPGLICPASYH